MSYYGYAPVIGVVGSFTVGIFNHSESHNVPPYSGIGEGLWTQRRSKHEAGQLSLYPHLGRRHPAFDFMAK